MVNDLDFSDIDSYLASLSRRIAALEVDSEDMGESSKDRYSGMFRQIGGFKEEMRRIRSEVSGLRDSVSELSREMDYLIKEFNGTVRKSSFERLMRRMEQFSPEDLATRESLRKLR